MFEVNRLLMCNVGTLEPGAVMDMGVALVQACLRAHGYFTVSEYPILEAIRHGEHRIATDIDILAVRFPHACQLVP